MQLRQTKVVGALNNDCVRRRDIDTGFDNGGTHQHVETLVMEIIHHTLEVAFTHLTVADGNARFRHEFGQPLRGFLDILDIVVEIINLPAAQNFTQDCLTHDQTVVLAHKGFHRHTTCRRCGNNRQVAHAAHGHVQRTRDRRCGQGKNIYVCTHRLDALFMTYAETVLFIDNQQSQIFPA
ncbi:hypothetical protein SRABI106_04200 [Rahnella aquatilis]|nr:hypothetical protein SRABI106_04200 [Rahnella aquatilis]